MLAPDTLAYVSKLAYLMEKLVAVEEAEIARPKAGKSLPIGQRQSCAHCIKTEPEFRRIQNFTLQNQHGVSDVVIITRN